MCIFSVVKLFCMCDDSYVRFGGTKDKYFNRSLRHGTKMRHRNLRSNSVHTGSIGTGAMLGHPVKNIVVYRTWLVYVTRKFSIRQTSCFSTQNKNCAYHRNGITEDISGFETVTFPRHTLKPVIVPCLLTHTHTFVNAKESSMGDAHKCGSVNVTMKSKWTILTSLWNTAVTINY